MMTEQKTYTIDKDSLKSAGNQNLTEMIALAGYTFEPEHSWCVLIEDKIKASLEFEHFYTFRHSPKTWKGVKLEFSHAGNSHKKTWRVAKAKDGVLDVAQLKAKIDELLELYTQYDRALEAQQEKRNDQQVRLKKLRDRCKAAGLELSRKIVNGKSINTDVSLSGVKLELEGLTPELAAKLVAMVEASFE